MKHGFANIIIMFVGLAIAVILASSVVMPSIVAPSLNPTATSINETDIIVTSAESRMQKFATSAIKTASGASLIVTFALNDTGTAKLLAYDETELATLTTSPQTIAIPASKLKEASTQTFIWTVETEDVELNVSNATLTYTQLSKQEQEGWDIGAVALWGILGLAIVATLALMALGRR